MSRRALRPVTKSGRCARKPRACIRDGKSTLLFERGRRDVLICDLFFSELNFLLLFIRRFALVMVLRLWCARLLSVGRGCALAPKWTEREKRANQCAARLHTWLKASHIWSNIVQIILIFLSLEDLMREGIYFRLSKRYISISGGAFSKTFDFFYLAT